MLMQNMMMYQYILQAQNQQPMNPFNNYNQPNQQQIDMQPILSPKFQPAMSINPPNNNSF